MATSAHTNLLHSLYLHVYYNYYGYFFQSDSSRSKSDEVLVDECPTCKGTHILVPGVLCWRPQPQKMSKKNKGGRVKVSTGTLVHRT